MKEYTKIREYINSYTGIDGGNRSARVWICGIEYGGSQEDADSEIAAPVSLHQIRAWDQDFKSKGEWENRAKWIFHRNIAKLMVSIIFKLRGMDGNPIALWKIYRDEFLYSPQGNEFKLNLFPWAFRDASDWKPGFAGFSSKEEYFSYCRSGSNCRFDKLVKLRQRLCPKLIICTGKTYRHDFAMAFGFEPKQLDLSACILSDSPLREIYKATSGSATLLVIPFPVNPSGLNSHRMISLAANAIVELGQLDSSDLALDWPKCD